MVSDAENSAAPKPNARGSFAKTPFTHVLLHIFNRKMSGTLRVAAGKHSAIVYFTEGSPAKVMTSVAGRDLGHILQKLGLITEEQLAECEAKREETGQQRGKVLLDLGIVDVPTLVRGLREQVLAKLIDIFAMTNGKYEFYEDVNQLVGVGADEVFPLDPFPLIMAGYRAYHKRYNLDVVVQKLHGKWVSLEEPEKIRRFRLSKNEILLCGAMLTEPKEVDALLADGTYNPDMVKYVLYVLYITNHLGIQETVVIETEIEREDQTSRLISSIPPVSNSNDPKMKARKQEIIDKAVAISAQSYYEMLGLQKGASVEDVRRAFFKLARRFHPDKVPSMVAAGVRDMVQYIFSNLSEAHATLTNPDGRAEYDRILEEAGRKSAAPSPSEDSVVRDTLEAETLYQKALVFMQRRKYDEADEAISRALELNPQEGEYLGLWAHMESLKRPQGSELEDLVEQMRKALKSNPKSERVLLYMAKILKRQNKHQSSQLFFQEVLEVNPKNVEAAREVQLWKIRNKNKKIKEEKSGGILKRFFK